MFGKPPFSYADPPNLGDKRDPNYDGNAPTFGYNYPPHVPIHPGHWNDTEPAWVPFPGQPCCPDEESECLCITSADTSKWDSVYNTVSSNSAGWGGDVAINSADWQSTFYTVSANSAVWNSANELLDLTSLSARWESAYNAVVACNGLIETYSGQNELYTESPVIGNGTYDSPITLNKTVQTKIEEAYKMVCHLIGELYYTFNKYPDKNNSAKWLHVSAGIKFEQDIAAINTSAYEFENQVYKIWDAIRHLSGSVEATNRELVKKWDELKKYIDKQDNSIKNDITTYINKVKNELNTDIRNISAYIAKNEKDWKNPTYTYVKENEMTTSNYNQYKTAGVIYFNEN